MLEEAKIIMQDIFENIAAMQENMQPLNINGLSGRTLRLSSKNKNKKREIMMVYGHHASLERMYGLAEEMSRYGDVTVPDLPGFGGMDSFYKIGMKPTLDNFADYLATFVKLRYKRKRVTIIGMSFGFVVVTRMLQRYPDLVKKVDILISMVGFAHHTDFAFSKQRKASYTAGSYFFSYRIPAMLFYGIGLRPIVLRACYAHTHNAKSKFEHLSEKEKKQAMDYEVELWRINDVRTHWNTAKAMFRLDNCDRPVDLPVHHISVDSDQYFNNAIIEQHMRIIFTDYIEYKVVLPNHAPSIIASGKEAAPYIPKKIRTLLS